MSPARPIVILYEDRRGPTRDFGLHKLVEACVFDVVNGQRHIVHRALDGRPMKGDSQLLRSCREDVHDISPHGEPVAAVFDNDKIRRLLKLRPDAAEEQVIQEIKTGAVAPDQLHVFLIEANMESVVAAAGECDPLMSKVVLREALQKNLAARDVVLVEAARAEKRAVRDCIQKRMPSFDRLIKRCAEWLLATDEKV